MYFLCTVTVSMKVLTWIIDGDLMLNKLWTGMKLSKSGYTVNCPTGHVNFSLPNPVLLLFIFRPDINVPVDWA